MTISAARRTRDNPIARVAYDADKAATGDCAYTSYGTIDAQAGAAAISDLPAAFTGKPLDPASGLYSFPYRMYSPELARWLPRDPLGMVDGPNVYGYVKASPCSYVDMDGRFPWPAFILCAVALTRILAVFSICYGYCPNNYKYIRVQIRMPRHGFSVGSSAAAILSVSKKRGL
jgi:RHS repeat-associated protein